ncbi:hypothetical protein HOLleu_03006 [Holothuria leucospilota]|uniref:Uncharacterized protein n=1 Tax=Holothuria leucospilota TaxID=206669 RepID=A0A9Q1CS14_HOLLE|nr:hypothetical protein HOLleu_03006 [Holothuria leucospilota]
MNSSDNEADSEYHPSSVDSGTNSDTDSDNPGAYNPPVDIPSTSGTCCSRADNLDSASTSTEKGGWHADSEDSKDDKDDSGNEEIHIKYSKRKKTENGEKMVYDKRNACLFCEKLIEVVIGRHYLSQHSSETELAQILAMPINSRERKVKLDLLRNRGNFYHNEKVMRSKSGEIILMRRPRSGICCDPQDYGPCPQCLGFVAKNDLWRHARYRCIARVQHEHTQSKKKRSQIRIECDILMKQFEGASDELKRTVLASMKRDDAFHVFSNDKLILEYGNQIFKNKKDRKHLVSQKMRAVTRIVLKLRENDPEGGQYISDFIIPSKFDKVVQAVEETCILIEGQNEDEYQFRQKP